MPGYSSLLLLRPRQHGRELRRVCGAAGDGDPVPQPPSLRQGGDDAAAFHSTALPIPVGMPERLIDSCKRLEELTDMTPLLMDVSRLLHRHLRRDASPMADCCTNEVSSYAVATRALHLRTTNSDQASRKTFGVRLPGGPVLTAEVRRGTSRLAAASRAPRGGIERFLGVARFGAAVKATWPGTVGGLRRTP